MKIRLSDLGRRCLTPSPVNRLTAAFAGDFRDGTDINLGVGYVNDSTIPAAAIREAYEHIIADPIRYRNALNYGGAEGSPNLIASLRNYYLRNHIGQLTQEDLRGKKILIGANGATSLLDAISDILDAGVVITSDPFYYIFTDTLERKGFQVLAIPEDEEGLSVTELRNELERMDTDSIRMFYIVTVNNPSSSILSNRRREEIARIVTALSRKQKRKIPLIMDKAYEDIIHGEDIEEPVSGLKHDELGNIFEVGTLSKVIAPALRIGYLIGNDPEFCQGIMQRTSDIGFSAPLINQEIAGWLLDYRIDQQREMVNRAYRWKAQWIRQALRQELAGFLESLSGGDAGFYFYLTLDKIETCEGSDFYRYLSRTTGIPEIDGNPIKHPRLVYIPGTICSKTPKARFQLRLSYGYEDIQVFQRAIQLLKEACCYSQQKS